MSATIQSSFDCLNVSTEMPPSSRVRISIQFEKKLLPESEYPPDISRGFDLPNPILVVDEHQLFLDPAVVLLPSPDLSMPFNVIAITSTLFAFLFGNLYNALFRDAEMLAEEQNKVSERLNKILTRFRRSGTKEKAE
jgi:phosphatidylinositol glycan class T